jgi:hypothetical protein
MPIIFYHIIERSLMRHKIMEIHINSFQARLRETLAMLIPCVESRLEELALLVLSHLLMVSIDTREKHSW